MGVVVLTTVLPGGRPTGSEIVTQGLLDALRAAGHEIGTVGYRRPGDRSPAGPGEVCAGHRPIETSMAGARSLLWLGRALAARAPYSVTKYRSRRYLRAARDQLGGRPEAVVLDSSRVEFALRGAGAIESPLILLAHNAESRLYSRLAAAARDPVRRWVNAREARLVRESEAALARRARQVWTLTTQDAEYFRSLHRDADVRTLEIALPVGEEVPPAEPECDVALIGTWSWEANARGLRWFAEEVVELIPDLRIEVAGAGAEWLRGRHRNLAVRGVVGDARRFLARARAVAVPSVTGGGVQVKTLDAIASGAPVVATRVAVRGLNELPRSVSLADDPEGFASDLRRAATTNDRAHLRAEAIDWSRARRERFEASVATWVADAAGGGGDRREPVSPVARPA